MSLKAKINDDMKAAMRAKDAPRLGAIRLLLAAMKQKEVDERVELTDADIVAIIDKMLKQRRESIARRVQRKPYDTRGRDSVLHSDDRSAVPREPVTPERRRTGSVGNPHHRLRREIETQNSMRVVRDIEQPSVG